jgi:hypothetical protein
MTKLSNVEKVEKTIFTVGSHFTVKNTVTTGVKGKDNVKLNPVYTRQYNSQKYSDKSTLEQMTIRTSDYIVMAYNDFQNKINEEIYISYPHMPEFIRILGQAVQMVSTEDMYVGNDVNPKYKDLVLRPAVSMGGQKSFAVIPHVIQRDQSVERGILLFLNSEEIYVEIDANNLYTMWYILEKFDLYLNSSLLLTTALVYDGGAVGGSQDAPSFGGGGNTFGASSNNRAPRGIFGGGSAGANAGGNKGTSTPPKFKPPVKNTTLNDLDKAIEGEDFNIPDSELPFTGGEPSSPSVPTPNNDAKSPLSLNNIMDAANEIDVPDLDDGELDF